MLFLSYRTRRAAELAPLRRALDAAGWELWRDEERVEQGEQLTTAVQQGIAASNGLIVWYTDDYEQSAICRWELRRAWIAAESQLSTRIYLLCAPGVSAPAHFPPELIHYAEDLPSFLSALRPPGEPFGPPPALPSVLPFPRPSSARFVGRVPELWNLHHLLSGSGSVQVRGLGGLGKSLLVVEYANLYATAWPGGIFWVEGDDLRIADLLGLPPGTDDQRRAALRHHLSQRGRYLWILDDTSIESQDAPTPNGQTLRTTRRMDRPGKCLDLEGLGETEALGLLSLWRPPENAVDSARRLCATLGYLPLALELLGALLRREPDPEPYPTWERKLARPGRDALALAEKLREELPTGSSRNLATVMGSSLALLDEAGWSLLLLMAELADAPLPRPFCVSLMGEDGVEAGLQQARRLSLLREEEDTFLLHPVLRRVLRLRPDHTDQRQVLGVRATQALLQRLQASDLSDPRLHSSLFALLPHARTRTEGELEEGAAQLLVLLSTLDHAAGRDLRARAGWERVLAWQSEGGTLSAERTLECQQNLAVVLARLGDLEKAKNLAEEAWKGRSLLLGATHPETLGSRQNLGVILSQAGENEAACHHFAGVLATDPPEELRLRCLQNLALSEKERGNLQESRRIYEDVLPRLAACWGPEHPDGARCLQNYGTCLLSCGELAAAEAAIREATERLTHSLGPEHPDRITALGNLVAVQKARGNWKEAELGYRSIYEQRRKLFGPDHPDSLILLHNLGKALHQLGSYPEALRCLEEAAAGQRRVLGPEHPALLLTLESQAVTLHTMGDRAGARQIYSALLADCSDLQRRAALIHNYARILQEEGDLAGARSHYEQVLRDRTQTCGEEHPDTLQTLNNLASTVYFQGNIDEAASLFERLFNARQRHLGGAHPDTLLARQGLALCKQAQGDLEGARSDYDAAYAGLCSSLGEEHPTVLVVLQNLAVTLQQLGDSAAAQQHYQTALQRHAAIFGMDHAGSLRILQNLAATEYALGDLHGSRAHYEQALSRLTRQWGETHTQTQLCRFNLLYPLFRLDPTAAMAQVHLLQELRERAPEGLNAAEQQVIAWLNQYFPTDGGAD